MLLPFPNQNRIIIFANDEGVLKHALDWAENLDSDHRTGISDDFFVYQAVNITAEHIAAVVSALDGEGSAPVSSIASSDRLVLRTQGGRAGREDREVRLAVIWEANWSLTEVEM